MASKKKAKKKLTARQRKYVAGLMDGQTKAAAARAAGFSEAMAHNPAVKIETPRVKEAFQALLEKAGITDELLARRIFEGLHAMETKFWQPRMAWRLNGNAGNVPTTGDAVPGDAELIQRDLVSFAERRAMVELVLKLTGKLVEKHEHKVSLYALLTESESG